MGSGGVVALGGGHGLAQALTALRRLDVTPTAVVTVADDGGSSGRLRRDLGIIAPGDLRMALLTLARNTGLADVLAHRFRRGELEGHALGNLLLVALAELHDGDFVPALRSAARLLDCAGSVLPSTTSPVHLRARSGGRDIDGQVDVATADAPIERIWLEPDAPPACQEAVAAIREADTVVLGPGSLFTSIIVNLVVPDIGAAVRTSRGRLVYVANLRTQPGETADLDLAAHVATLTAHLGDRRLDGIVIHDGPVVPGPGQPLGTDLQGSVHTDTEVVRMDLAPTSDPSQGHDPERLAQALSRFVAAHAR